MNGTIRALVRSALCDCLLGRFLSLTCCVLTSYVPVTLQKSVISWLLNHDPAKRPTATELLKSELLPPPQMEESELHEVLHHTLANIDGKAYRTMMGQIFSQHISPAIDYTYDSDILKVARPCNGVFLWMVPFLICSLTVFMYI